MLQTDWIVGVVIFMIMSLMLSLDGSDLCCRWFTTFLKMMLIKNWYQHLAFECPTPSLDLSPNVGVFEFIPIQICCKQHWPQSWSCLIENVFVENVKSLTGQFCSSSTFWKYSVKTLLKHGSKSIQFPEISSLQCWWFARLYNWKYLRCCDIVQQLLWQNYISS